MAFDYYFVSVTGKYSEDLLVKLNANALFSYYQDMTALKKFIQLKRDGHWKGKLIVDNGAYTLWKQNKGVIDIDDYIEFLNSNFDVIDYAIALDVIPGGYQRVKTIKDIIEAAEKTWNNYLYMREHIQCIEKLIPAFHQDDPFEYLTRYLSLPNLPYICIAAHDMNTRINWYDRCFRIIKNSNNPNIKIHCLGNSLPNIVEQFPFTSIDASSWKLTAATGSVMSDIGPIYVGKQFYIDTLPETIKRTLQELCNKCGVASVNDLSKTYASRALYNMYYLYNKSVTTEKTNKVFKIERRLF